MSIQRPKLTALATAMAIVTCNNAANAEPVRVLVRIENAAPLQGTSQTPIWVGFHAGDFDVYDRNQPASNDPQPGSIALERIAEDGNAGPITDEFAALGAGVDATLAGANGPIAPSEAVYRSFVIDSDNPDTRFFSYASMVLPSNDFFIANGNAQAHQVFDDSGNFVAAPFFVQGSEVLDAGTEVNDEVPSNTAFFGQAAPNTGVIEDGLVIGQDTDPDTVRFQPAATGNILGTPRFAMADFTVPGYSMIKVSLSSASLVEALDVRTAVLRGSNAVPSNSSRAIGISRFTLEDDGESLRYRVVMAGLRDVTMAHLHLGAPGETGPVLVDLLADNPDPRRVRRLLSGEIAASDLSASGPLAGQPLDALSQAIADGQVYLNIHSSRFPAGEIRANLSGETR